MDIQFDVKTGHEIHRLEMTSSIAFLCSDNQMTLIDKTIFGIEKDEDEKILQIFLELEITPHYLKTFLSCAPFSLTAPQRAEYSRLFLKLKFRQEELQRYEKQLNHLKDISQIFQFEGEGTYPLFLDLRNYELHHLEEISLDATPNRQIFKG